MIQTETPDLTFGTLVTPRKMINSRVISMTILMSTASISDIILGWVWKVERNLDLELLTFLVTWLYLSGVGRFLTGIAILTRIDGSYENKDFI